MFLIPKLLYYFGISGKHKEEFIKFYKNVRSCDYLLEEDLEILFEKYDTR